MFDASLFLILVLVLATGIAAGRLSGLVELGRGIPVPRPLPAFAPVLILAALKTQRTAHF